MMPFQFKVSCKYGAPMGRITRPLTPGETPRLHLVRVPLDSGGYDSGGAYWGHGAPLYCVWDDETNGVQYVRAADREQARARFPGKRFYR